MNGWWGVNSSVHHDYLLQLILSAQHEIQIQSLELYTIYCEPNVLLGGISQYQINYFFLDQWVLAEECGVLLCC